jgi:Flp pilus assembly protein TadD
MAKPGRNDPCPCGSGKKYKKCCLPKDEAQKRAALADEQANREEGTMARRFDVHDLKEALAERLARTGHDNEDDEIAYASHAVVELVQAGTLAAAEAAARDLLTRYPDEPDGWDCLGIVHEARGENRQAADCYRKMRDIMRHNPDDYDPAYETEFAELIARLDPPTAP